MRVLILITQMEAGGAQKASLVLARGLKRRGHHVVVASMYDKEDYISIFNKHYGLEIINLHMKVPGSKLMKGQAFLAGLRELRHVMKRECIDVVQTFSHYSNLIGPVVARTAGVPIRVSSQRMSLREAPNWLRFLDKMMANSSIVQMMTAVSESTRDYCIQEEGIKPEKLLTICNGIDVARYGITLSAEERTALCHELGVPETAVIVTQVARLHLLKGHQYLLQAIPDIVSVVPDAHFVLVGEGALRTQIEAGIREAGLDKWVHLLGMRQDIPQILSISNLFILPSLGEGMPNSILEAMAAGLPVVASNVGGNPEVVVDGETGILVAAAEPAPLADGILKILQNPDLAVQMGLAARKRAEEIFSVDKNVSSYEQLYEQLLANNG